MDIANLTAFITVAEEESFSAAASRLHLTQPAISKRIAALEEDLGSALFDRIRRKASLTDAGRALLPHAHRVLEAVAESRRAIGEVGDIVAGRLTIGTSHHIGLHRLPSILREFNSNYPQVELDIRFMDSEEVCRAVESAELEMGIVTLPLRHSRQLNTELIWPDPLGVVAASDHPLAGKKRYRPDDLAHYPAILPARGTYTRETVEKAFRPLNLDLNVTLSTNYLETIKMLVSVGFGWSVLPLSMVRDDTNISVFSVVGLSLKRELGIVKNRHRSLSTAARTLEQMLRQHRSRSPDAIN